MEKVILKEYVKIKTGKLDANASEENGIYPFFTCAREISRINSFAFDCECVLVAGNGELNVKYYEGKFNAYQRTYVIESIDKKVLSTKYLYYFIDSYIEKLRNGAIGGVIKYIKLNHLTDIILPLPELETQNKIVAILDKAKGIIEKREKSIWLFNELLRASFLNLFGDPVINEKGWEKFKLDDISEIQGGLQVTTKRVVNSIELPYLRVANVYRDKLSLNEIKTILVTDAEAIRTRLEKGDILIVEGHGNPNEIGRSAVWDGSIENCLHQNHLIRVRLNQEISYPKFISYFLNTAGGREQMLKAGKTTSGLNTISTKNVKETFVIVPPIDLQNKFENHLLKIDSIKERLIESKEKLERLISGLSQTAFEGSLSFNTAVDLEVLMENDYNFFKDNSNTKSIQLLLERLEKDELNEKKFSEQEIYDKAKGFVFELLKEGKVKQVFDEKTKRVKLTV